jgi:uncharacterized protein (DUF1778 family)
VVAVGRALAGRRCKQKRNPARAIDLDQRGDSAAAASCQPGKTVNEEGSAMPEKIDDLIPTAREIQKQAAIKEAEKADEDARRLAAAEAEKRTLIERLSKPSGLSEDEKVKLASTVIQRAVRNGLTEVQVYRFPHSLCTDNGRAINQQEPGWEKTLTGIAQEIFQLWFDYLKPRGYRIRYQIVDFPGGMPGDIGIVIVWGD